MSGLIPLSRRASITSTTLATTPRDRATPFLAASSQVSIAPDTSRCSRRDSRCPCAGEGSSQTSATRIEAPASFPARRWAPLMAPQPAVRIFFIRDEAGTYHHQTCTAKMGRDSLSVVDAQLKVYGIDNLRIADGSIMPRVMTGNTMAACIIIGERAGQILRAEHKI